MMMVQLQALFKNSDVLVDWLLQVSSDTPIYACKKTQERGTQPHGPNLDMTAWTAASPGHQGG